MTTDTTLATSDKPLPSTHKYANILHTLRAGMVPDSGLGDLQVGRLQEVKTMMSDIDRLVSGKASFRFVIGQYGSGKTFFMKLVKDMALGKNLVVTHADMNPDRRLQGTKGQARSLYTELMANISTRSKRKGGALQGIVEMFIARGSAQAKKDGVTLDAWIDTQMEPLLNMVNGFDFVKIIRTYYQAYMASNEAVKIACMKWLRGEYTTKTEARETLDVRAVVDDAGVYDHLKLMGAFFRLAGFSGFLIEIDELVNIFKLPNAQAREKNYEQILRMFNDCMQNSDVGIGFLLGGTPEFVTHPQRGMYSYDALKSRLSTNTFATNGLVDTTGPLIQLPALTREDFLLLLANIRDMHAEKDSSKFLVPDDGLVAFMDHCQKRLGDQYYRTPRTAIVSFLHWFSVIEQNPQYTWKSILEGLPVLSTPTTVATVVATTTPAVTTADGTSVVAASPVPVSSPVTPAVISLDPSGLDGFVLDIPPAAPVVQNEDANALAA